MNKCIVKINSKYYIRKGLFFYRYADVGDILNKFRWVDWHKRPHSLSAFSSFDEAYQGWQNHKEFLVQKAIEDKEKKKSIVMKKL